MLVVSGTLPPAPLAVAFVVDNFSRQFSPEEMVIAGESNTGSATYQRDPALPALHYVSREWTWPQRGKKYVRWMRWFEVPLIARRLSRIVKREKCGAILAIFPDERLLTAAYLVAKRHGLKLYPHFHNTYLDQRQGMSRRYANWLQPRVFNYSDVVFVMSEGMQTAWQDLYPGIRFEPLVHTFQGEIPAYTPPPACHQPVRMAFLGNLNSTNLDAMGRLARLAQESEEYRLTIYSGSPAWFYAKVGITGERISQEQPSDEELMDKLRSNDVMLLPHGLTGDMLAIEYQTIFPTRTIPYLLSGRPILAHSPRDSFLTRWLRRHDCAEIVDEADFEAVKRAIQRLRDDPARRETLVRNALTAAKQFHGPHVAGQFRRIVAESFPS